ncbi:hypothetical protein [Thalassospira sp. CH_XMU1448-2]|uniref:hypothetical protein n=1 Tax=Thalassospira sp. CH_XMU1448-2 TaxID=3107773 RepID=UPI0030096882
MNELIRTFFIFSFAVVAFSQYMRTSSSSLVNDLRNKARELDDRWRMLHSSNEEILNKLGGNSEYKNKKEILFSSKCDIQHDGKWYYVLFFYLCSVIVFAAIESVMPSVLAGYLSYMYLYKDQISGVYCLIGIFLNMAVFRSGHNAIKPRSLARETHKDLETIHRTLIGF